MDYKLLALDIDGTIVPEGTDEISPRVAAALRKAANRVVIALVTARSHNNLNTFLEIAKLPKAFHVVENGAKIINPKGELVRDLHIPHAEVQEMINSVTGHFIELGFCTDNHWLDDEEEMPYATLINGLSFTCEDEVHAQMVHSTIQNMPQGYASYIVHHWSVPEWAGVLVFHKDATKGNGMHYIQEQLGILPEETIAVGDAGTDISMFEFAGVKVAMGNAEQRIIQSSNFIAPSVDEDGVAEVIDKLILEIKD